MRPPVCKTCKAEEWSHICGGKDARVVVIDAVPGERGKTIRVKVDPLTIKDAVMLCSKTKVPEPITRTAKFDRAAYMRERHAKRKLASQA